MPEIILTPELLIAQSKELSAIQGEYDALFIQVTASLNGVNDNWSENLAKNFAGKISAAQKSFSSISNMLANGSAAASNVAMSFESGLSLDTALTQAMSTDGSTGGVVAGAGGTAAEPSTTDKARQVSEHYSQKAADYREKAAESYARGDFAKGLSYSKKALEVDVQAAKYKGLQGITAAGSTLGWDNKNSYEKFGKAMENTPIVKDGWGIGKGIGMMAQGQVYEGIGEVGRNIPVVGDGWKMGEGVGMITQGDTYNGVDKVMSNIPIVKNSWGIGKGVGEIGSGNPYQGVDDIGSNVPVIKDGWKIGKAIGGWTDYSISLK